MNNNFQMAIISEENPSFCSLIPATREERKTLMNAIDNPTHKMSEFINMEIEFSNVYMSKAVIYEKDDAGNPIPGSEKEVIKTILIMPDGQSIMTHSNSVVKSLYTMFQIFGMPNEWEEPMRCLVKQVDFGKNRMFKLEVI